ncbi:MAG: hypothetical protein NT027_06255 [Proteobacteria bacterium]|nr:hypothetical protein [Pseudomonadota bacterium]
MKLKNGQRRGLAVVGALLASALFAAGGDFDLETAQRERDDAARVLNAANAELQSAQSSVSGIEQQLNQNRQEISRYKQDLAASEAGQQSARQEKLDLERANPNLVRQAELARERSETLAQEARSIEQNDLEVLNRQMNQIDNRIRALNTEIARLEQNSHAVEIRRLKNEQATLHQRAKALQDQIEDLKTIQIPQRLQNAEMQLERASILSTQSAADLEGSKQQTEIARAALQGERATLRAELTEDINPKRETIKAKIAELEAQPGNEAEIKNLKVALKTLTDRAVAVNARIKDLDDNVIAPARAKAQELKISSDKKKAESQACNAEAQRLHKEAQTIRTTQLEPAQQELTTVVRPRAVVLRDKIAELEALDASNNAIIAEKVNQRDELNRERRTKEAEIVRLNRQVANLRSQSEAKQQESQQLYAQVRANESRISELARYLQESETHETQIRKYISDLESYQTSLESQLSIARSNATQAQIAANSARRVYDAKNARYVEVQQNVTRAQNEAIDLAKKSASGHGSTAGSQTSSQDGKIHGADAGNTAGERKGSSESMVRSLRRGFNEALQNPSIAQVSFEAGIKTGAAKASADAQVSAYPESYNSEIAKLVELIPTKQITSSINDTFEEVSEDNGLHDTKLKVVSAINAPAIAQALPDVSFEAPSINSISVTPPSVDLSFVDKSVCQKANPLFIGLCESKYDGFYSAEFKRVYTEKYQASYIVNYNENAKVKYSEARDRQVTGEQEKGRKLAAHEQGVTKGYADAISQAQTLAGQKAVEDFSAKLQSSSLLRAVSLEVKDQNDDGILSPNEGLSFATKIDNIGGKPTKTGSVKLKITKLTGAQSEVLLKDLPSLGADTQTELLDLFPSKVTSAANGSVDVAIEIVHTSAAGQETIIGSLKVKAEVDLPIKVIELKVGTPVLVGETGELIFTLQNKTKKDFEAGALASMEASVGVASNTSIPVVLNALSTSEIKIPFTVGAAAGSNQNFPIKLTLDGLEGVPALTQTFSAPISAKLDAAVVVCLPLCTDTFEMPLKARAGQTFELPIALKALNARIVGKSLKLAKTNFSSPTIMPSPAGSFSSKFVTPSKIGEISTSEKFSIVFPKALIGQRHFLAAEILEGNKSLHKLFVPVDVVP